MKEILVRYLERNVYGKKDKLIDYTSVATIWEEDGFTKIELLEGQSEFGLEVKRTIELHKNEIRQLRVAEDLGYENELIIFGENLELAKGHYICRFNPELSSVLDAEVFCTEYNEGEIHINYDLYANGVYLGNFDTKYLLVEYLKN